MNTRSGLLLTCATATLVIGAFPMWSAARAADALPVTAEPVPVDGPWWFHGYLEVGGRGFVNNPQDGGSRWQGGGQSSLAKYYEYSTVKPGPFGDFWMATGSPNGLWELDAFGKNVGYDDQRYVVDLSKAGEHYLTLGWDQVPHVYSDGAQTLYNGVGSNHLTLPAGLSNKMFGDAGCIFGVTGPTGCVSPITPANAAKVQADILNNIHQIGLGIRRDTASVEYRYTPTDAWDIRTNYTNTRRTGTQVDGVVFSSATSGVAVQAPKPVADTTQNYGASGEYAGTSFWNQKFNIKVAYSGSTYTDDANSYTLENPFCPTGAIGDQCARGNTGSPPAVNNSLSSPLAQMSLPPSNQANGVTSTLGMDLPFTSRYMGTASYTMMRQNDQFLPFTVTSAFANNGGAGVPLGWKGTPGIPANSLAALPATSLNGSINTLLLNNVLTTQITPTLKSKLSYRYYDYDNDTPELHFADWIQSDVVAASAQSLHAPVTSLTFSYIKQNGGAELNWRPTREWNLGAGYGYERYDWTRASASATDEHAAKFFADWKPTHWFTARGNFSYGLRRTDNYKQNVGLAQWLPGSANLFQNTYRQLNLGDRDRTTAKLLFDIALSPTVTLTPTVGYRDDWYRINPQILQGLESNQVLSAGVELAYIITPDTNVLLAYMNEQQQQRLNMDNSADGVNGPFIPANVWSTRVDDRVNTYMVAVNHTVIPNKFDIRASYTASSAVDHQPWNNPGGSIAAPLQFPDVKSLFQRFDVTGIYTVDPDFVHRMGWNGTVKAKLRYVWERNSVANWANDMMAPYMYSGAAGFNNLGYMTWMAYNNPNYDAQMISGSIVVGW
jgi:hypothetical protein